MNYTRPDLPGHQDDPKDWLNSAMIFARSLGILLKEKEGVVVELHGDMEFDNLKKVIVYNEGHQIHIAPCEEDLSEGQMVWMDGLV